mgnify:CR=1 FL=1
MSLSSYIENLRERPEHIRRRAAFWWSFGFTIIVFAFWVASFTSIGIGFGSGAQRAVSVTAEKIVTPGQSLVAGVGAFAGDVWSMIVGPKTVTYQEVEVTPGKR